MRLPSQGSVSARRDGLLALTTLLMMLVWPLPAATLDSATTSGTNFAVAAFRFWSPGTAGVLRGVVVLLPGSNADGRALVEDEFWQTFARRHQFGLVGCLFKDHPHENMNIEEYARASAGSGQALLVALSDLAARAKHPEVASAPLLLWGHSAGGEFNYEFACWKPERVLAFVVNKGGYYFTHLASAAARHVPGILFVGEKDLEFRNRSVRGLFSVNRESGALWTLAIEPGAAHEIGRTRELASAYFAAVLRMRLADASGAMQPAPRRAWTGNLQSQEIFPVSSQQDNGALTVWLPDATFAREWQAFIRGQALPAGNADQTSLRSVEEMRGQNATLRRELSAPDGPSGRLQR
jgi:dienelactone hydrolase